MRVGKIFAKVRWFVVGKNPLSYISNRKQCCKVKGKLSDLGEVTYGLPQGSCLGSLFFIICINDLPLSLSTHKSVCMPMTPVNPSPQIAFPQLMERLKMTLNI